MKNVLGHLKSFSALDKHKYLSGPILSNIFGVAASEVSMVSV